MFSQIRGLIGTRTSRYLLVGASVNGSGYVLYLLLTWGGLTPRLAVTAIMPVGLLAAFHLHGRVTFATDRKSMSEGVRFIAVALAGYALNLGLLTLLVDGADIPHPIAQLVSVVLVALTNFQLLQRFVFSSSASSLPVTAVRTVEQGPRDGL